MVLCRQNCVRRINTVGYDYLKEEHVEFEVNWHANFCKLLAAYVVLQTVTEIIMLDLLVLLLTSTLKKKKNDI